MPARAPTARVAQCHGVILRVGDVARNLHTKSVTIGTVGVRAASRAAVRIAPGTGSEETTR